MINKRYLPQIPPGMIFVSNHAGWDREKKIPKTELSIAEDMSQRLNIPSSEFTILKEVAEGARFSSFLPEAYESIVKAWTDHIDDMLKILTRLEEME